jgi:uncharacterized membrane protein YjjP (DUF1212 family)
MNVLAAKLQIETLDTNVTLNSIVATASLGNCVVTLVRENTLIGLNAHRLAVLDQLLAEVDPGMSPAAIDARLDAVERMPPLHSLPATAIAVGFACGGFASLNGASLLACGVAAMSAAVGQALRILLLRCRLNQLVVTAICAAFASALYWMIARAPWWMNPGKLDDAAGFISSVLFLVPGFPLVTALLDLIRLHLTSGLSRIAYGVMLLMAGSAGLGLVSGVAGLVPPTATVGGPASVSLLHGFASFVSGAGFAILYNSTWRAALAVGILAVIGNLVRLHLHAVGLPLASATCLGALVVGLAATWGAPHVQKPRIALTVPGVIVMIPGLLSYDTMTLFSRGHVMAALTTGIQAGFILAAMAMGLAVARILTDKAWALDDVHRMG